MTYETIQVIGGEAILLALMLSAVPLLTAVVVGVASAVIQAATQVQEQTLTFVPKLIAVSAVLTFVGPSLMEQLRRFTVQLLESIPQWTI